MKKFKLIAISILVVGVLVFADSCKKVEDEPNITPDSTEVVLNLQSAPDAGITTEIYSEIIANVLVNTDENDGTKSSGVKGCPNVSLSPTVGYPKTLTIDYGTGCTHNGHTKSGTITASISDNLKKPGTTITITMTTFKIDTISISGTVAITIDSVKLASQTIYLHTVLTNCTVAIPKGTASVDGFFYMSWFLDSATNYNDDVITSDSASFTANNMKNKDFTFSVLSPIVYPVSCGHITQGQLQIWDLTAAYPATLDFGSGTCDNLVEICTKKEITFGNKTIYQDYCFDISIP